MLLEACARTFGASSGARCIEDKQWIFAVHHLEHDKSEAKRADTLLKGVLRMDNMDVAIPLQNAYPRKPEPSVILPRSEITVRV